MCANVIVTPDFPFSHELLEVQNGSERPFCLGFSFPSETCLLSKTLILGGPHSPDTTLLSFHRVCLPFRIQESTRGFKRLLSLECNREGDN